MTEVHVKIVKMLNKECAWTNLPTESFNTVFLGDYLPIITCHQLYHGSLYCAENQHDIY